MANISSVSFRRVPSRRPPDPAAPPHRPAGARVAHLAASFEETGEYGEGGSVSAQDWLRHHRHMGGGQVSDRVTVGRELPRLGAAVHAMAGCRVGFGHLVLLARTQRVAGEASLDRLLERAQEVSVGRFRLICEHARHAADPEGVAREQKEQSQAQRLSILMGEDGTTYLRGRLDRVGGAALRGALAPWARKLGRDDERPREQRLAEALVELASGNRPAQVSVTVSLETLLGLRGVPGGEFDHGLPIAQPPVELEPVDDPDPLLAVAAPRRRTAVSAAVSGVSVVILTAPQAPRPRLRALVAPRQVRGRAGRGAARRPRRHTPGRRRAAGAPTTGASSADRGVARAQGRSGPARRTRRAQRGRPQPERARGASGVGHRPSLIQAARLRQPAVVESWRALVRRKRPGQARAARRRKRCAFSRLPQTRIEHQVPERFLEAS